MAYCPCCLDTLDGTPDDDEKAGELCEECQALEEDDEYDNSLLDLMPEAFDAGFLF